MIPQEDLTTALSAVVEAFDKLHIQHCIGGSVASSFHGAARGTMDVDLLCELTSERMSDFLACFNEDYYVSESAVRDAIERQSCFNLIHLPTSFKIDVFVSEGRPFDSIRLERAKRERIGTSPAITVSMSSAEDVVVSKLEWFRKGHETSERQWDDVSRLMRLIAATADVAYLREAAESINVADLLQRLLDQT